MNVHAKIVRTIVCGLHQGKMGATQQGFLVPYYGDDSILSIGD